MAALQVGPAKRLREDTQIRKAPSRGQGKNGARIPPGVANIDFQYPSFRQKGHVTQNVNKLYMSFQRIHLI